MSNSLYDISVGSYLQSLAGVSRVLEKGARYASDNNLNADDFVNSRLHSDMLPLLFQVNCVYTQTVGALDSLQTGVFTPPKSSKPLDYAGMQSFVKETAAELEAVRADEVNAAQGRSVLFKMGELEMPFTAENFILSFSLPNLYFHAATAYDILRMNGVPLGKADYLGTMRLGS